MSKVLILGDTHFGIKNHDNILATHQVKFFKEVLIPYIKKNHIKTIVQTGDWFDSRRAIRHATLHLIRQEIIPLIDKDQTWYVLVGNHDMGLKECIHPNSCTEILGVYENFKIIDKPTTVNLEGVDVDLIPWICQENKKDIKTFIGNSLSKYAIGHFELSGFYYYKGLASDGENKGFLSNYIQVWSGHFHTRSENGNIRYVGTPYQLTYGDADDPRGFEVFDTETKEIEFIQNPINLYTKIYYNHKTFDKDTVPLYKNMHVKIIITDRGNAAAFDMLVEEFAKHAYTVDVIDNFDVISTDSSLKIDITDTLKIINDYIDELDETDNVKKNVKKIMTALYKEATSV